MRWAVIGVVLSGVGCNQVFAIDRTDLVDAAVPADTDEDGVPDSLDNCPLVANPSQHDEDGDLFGDDCDNCPIVSNPTQGDLGDSDGVGDVCDPRADQAGDCLILVDTFVDPASFATHWRTSPDTPATAVITPESDRLRLAPPSNDSLALQVLGNDGQLLTGMFDVVMTGHIGYGNTGWLGTAGVLETRANQFACLIRNGMTIEMVWGTFSALGPLSSVGVTDDVLIRFDETTFPPPSSTKGNCRIDYGVGVGTLVDMDLDTTIPVGGAAIVAGDAPTTVDAFAVYDSVTPCPAPIRR